MCSSVFIWHYVNVTYGKAALCCLWEMPCHSQAIGCALSVSTLLTPSVCLVKVQPACVTHDRSGCPCFVCPVVLVPWQLWFILSDPLPRGLHHALCCGTGILHAWLSEPDMTSPSFLLRGPSASSCTWRLVPGFAWTGGVWSFCISQQVGEVGPVLLPQAWSQGSHPVPGSKVWGSHLCAPLHPPQSPRRQSRQWLWSILPTHRCSFGRGLQGAVP